MLIQFETKNWIDVDSVISKTHQKYEYQPLLIVFSFPYLIMNRKNGFNKSINYLLTFPVV